MVAKVLVSLPVDALRRIDAAARRRGEPRSRFIMRAALAEAEGRAPIAGNRGARARLRLILLLSERRHRMKTADALRARDRGRR